MGSLDTPPVHTITRAQWWIIAYTARTDLNGYGETVELQIAGRGGINEFAIAAVVNFTTVSADQRGFLTVYPCSDDRPSTSSINFDAGEVSNNEIVAALSDAGTVCVFSSVATGLVLDASGSIDALTDYQPIVPARALDTRPGDDIAAGDVVEVSRTSAVNFERGQVVANEIITFVPDSGTICLSASVSVDAIVDVIGSS